MVRALAVAALVCAYLTACSGLNADYLEGYADYDYINEYEYTEDGADTVADLYDDYDADDMADLAQSYDYSSEDQVEVCIEDDEGSLIINSPELEGCNMVVSSADDDFQEGIETVEGFYQLKGCRKGFPYYVKKQEGIIGEARMMWFSPQYFDWTISSTDNKRLAAKTRYLMAYGGSTYIDDSSLKPTSEWHVVRSISSVDDFFSTFSVNCVVAKPIQDEVDAHNASGGQKVGVDATESVEEQPTDEAQLEDAIGQAENEDGSIDAAEAVEEPLPDEAQPLEGIGQADNVEGTTDAAETVEEPLPDEEQPEGGIDQADDGEGGVDAAEKVEKLVKYENQPEDNMGHPGNVEGGTDAAEAVEEPVRDAQTEDVMGQPEKVAGQVDVAEEKEQPVRDEVETEEIIGQPENVAGQVDVAETVEEHVEDEVENEDVMDQPENVEDSLTDETSAEDVARQTDDVEGEIDLAETMENARTVETETQEIQGQTENVEGEVAAVVEPLKDDAQTLEDIDMVKNEDNAASLADNEAVENADQNNSRGQVDAAVHGYGADSDPFRSKINFSAGQVGQHISSPISPDASAMEQPRNAESKYRHPYVNGEISEGVTTYAVPIAFVFLIFVIVVSVMGYRKLSGKKAQAEVRRVKYEKV